jgi:putative ABC transport system permease protein
MAILRRIAAGLGAMVHKRRTEAELDEELRSYVEAFAAGKMKEGMSREEALRAARMEMGSIHMVKEEVRAVSWESGVESVWHDAR